MRQDPSYFDTHEPRLIYIAKRLRDAQRLEQLLAEAGVDYGVEADRYRGGFLFVTDRIGAFFYVGAEAEPAARDLLARWRFRAVDAAHANVDAAKTGTD